MLNIVHGVSGSQAYGDNQLVLVGSYSASVAPVRSVGFDHCGHLRCGFSAEALHKGVLRLWLKTRWSMRSKVRMVGMT